MIPFVLNHDVGCHVCYQSWSREEKNHCLEETEKSFKHSGEILRLILSWWRQQQQGRWSSYSSHVIFFFLCTALMGSTPSISVQAWIFGSPLLKLQLLFKDKSIFVCKLWKLCPERDIQVYLQESIWPSFDWKRALMVYFCWIRGARKDWVTI